MAISDVSLQREAVWLSGSTKTVRADPDAIMHTTGGGEPAFGNKFVMMAVRRSAVHERLLLALDHVPDHGGRPGSRSRPSRG